MAVRNVPPTSSYNGTNTAGRQSRSFAALYEQARKASINDNGAFDDATGNGGNNARSRNAERAAQAAQANDAERNRRYIDDLHENVDTLRGEILVRVINAGNPQRSEDTEVVARDISRLSTRLDSLRKKLQQEEVHLSGKLIDVEI